MSEKIYITKPFYRRAILQESVTGFDFFSLNVIIKKFSVIKDYTLICSKSWISLRAKIYLRNRESFTN